jgi:PAT family beta-lactamase induction signal transducer AmpG
MASAGRWVGTLFFAEGVPATVVGVVSSVVLKRAGLANDDIALYTGALVLPWILRPLWSPLLELLQDNRTFVVTTEALMAAALAGLAAALGAGSSAGVVLALFAFIAVTAASHDMAADGLYIASLSPQAQARYVGWMGVAYNAGKLAVQGLLVIAAGALEMRLGVAPGWRVVFLALSAVLAVLAVVHVRWLPAAPRAERAAPALGATSRAVVRTFFQKKNLGWALALLVLYRLAEGQFVRIAPLLLLDPAERGGVGLGTAEFGLLFGVFGAAAYMSGAVVGGFWVERRGLARALPGLCAAFNLPGAVYLLLAWAQPRSLAVVTLAVVAEQLAGGIGSVGLKLVTMRSLAAGPFHTSHYALASGLAALSATLAGMSSGFVQSWLGYSGFFVWTILAALPALVAAAVCARRLGSEDAAPPAAAAA